MKSNVFTVLTELNASIQIQVHFLKVLGSVWTKAPLNCSVRYPSENIGTYNTWLILYNIEFATCGVARMSALSLLDIYTLKPLSESI